MRASSLELAVWRQRIADHERGSNGSLELEMYRALCAERWHSIDMEARVREMAADRRELPSVPTIRALAARARHQIGLRA
jgi:hypothetical protein